MASDEIKGGGRLGPGKAFVTLYIDRELLTRIDRLAANHDESRSKYIAGLLADAVTQEELGVQVFTNPVLMKAYGAAMSQPGVLRQLLNTMRSDLNDSQLELFQRAVATFTQDATKQVKLSRARKRDKRTKGSKGK